MTLRLSDATRQIMVASFVGRSNENSPTAGQLRIYSGARPGTIGGTSGTLLATVTLLLPAFSSSNGVATLNDAPAVAAAASGTAGWFALLTGNGTVYADGSVTATGGGGDLTLSTISFTAGMSVDVTGGPIIMPGGN